LLLGAISLYLFYLFNLNQGFHSPDQYPDLGLPEPTEETETIVKCINTLLDLNVLTLYYPISALTGCLKNHPIGICPKYKIYYLRGMYLELGGLLNDPCGARPFTEKTVPIS